LEHTLDLDTAGLFPDKHTLIVEKYKVPIQQFLLMRSIQIGNTIAILLVWFSWTGCATFKKPECDEIIPATSESSGPSRSYEEKGIRLVDKAKWASASEAFEQAIALDRNNGSAHNNLGLAYYYQRKLALAAAEFELASGLLPEDPAPLNNLGMTLEAAGRGLESVEYYAQAHDLAPDKPLYLGNLVRNRIRLGDRDESVVEQLRELLFIETRPEWIEWVEDQLAIEQNPHLDRGPLPPNLNSAMTLNGTRPSKSSGKPWFSNPASNRAANDLLNFAPSEPTIPPQSEVISKPQAVPNSVAAPTNSAASNLLPGPPARVVPAPIVPAPDSTLPR
jgi:TPR repeat